MSVPRSAQWFRSLLWDLHEAYDAGDETEDHGWPAWRELFISADESKARRRATLDRLMAEPYGLPEGTADGMLRTVYWINEHFVYSERELSEYIGSEGKRLAAEDALDTRVQRRTDRARPRKAGRTGSTMESQRYVSPADHLASMTNGKEIDGALGSVIRAARSMFRLGDSRTGEVERAAVAIARTMGVTLPDPITVARPKAHRRSRPIEVRWDRGGTETGVASLDLARVVDVPQLLRELALELADRESEARVAALATRAASERYPTNGSDGPLRLVAERPLAALLSTVIRDDR